MTSAAHHFKEVTRLDPHRVGAFVNLGAVLNLLDQLDDAIVALRRSIQLDGKRVEGYYNLGLVYRRKGQLDLAIQSYREALALTRAWPTLISIWGIYSSRRGNSARPKAITKRR